MKIIISSIHEDTNSNTNNNPNQGHLFIISFSDSRSSIVLRDLCHSKDAFHCQNDQGYLISSLWGDDFLIYEENCIMFSNDFCDFSVITIMRLYAQALTRSLKLSVIFISGSNKGKCIRGP